MSAISSVTKFVKNIPKKHFAITSFVIVLVALAIWFGIYHKHATIIHEKFADIVSDVKSACNDSVSFPDVFKTTEFVDNTEKCEFCNDAALIANLS